MKTVNGIPQFFDNEFNNPPIDETKELFANQKLQLWSESRKCTMCDFLSEKQTGCHRIGHSIFVTHDIKPENFSCIEFREKI